MASSVTHPPRRTDSKHPAEDLRVALVVLATGSLLWACASLLVLDVHTASLLPRIAAERIVEVLMLCCLALGVVGLCVGFVPASRAAAGQRLRTVPLAIIGLVILFAFELILALRTHITDAMPPSPVELSRFLVFVTEPALSIGSLVLVVLIAMSLGVAVLRVRRAHGSSLLTVLALLALLAWLLSRAATSALAIGSAWSLDAILAWIRHPAWVFATIATLSGIAALSLTAALLLARPHAVRLYSPPGMRLCPICHYDLTPQDDHAASECPECGWGRPPALTSA
ncbi:MAG: hypothetical protein AAFX05_06625 [Planctomycetota bacterium]